MIEFVQANASWIVLGALFLLMMRMHGGGAGCCGGHQHERQQEQRPDQKPESLPAAQPDEKTKVREKEPVASGNHRQAGGCH